MKGFSGVVTSAMLGTAIAVGATALSAILGSMAGRGAGARSLAFATAFSSMLRLAGALLGVSIGVALGPPSIVVFVGSFLAVFMAAQAILLFRFGRPSAELGRSRRSPGVSGR